MEYLETAVLITGINQTDHLHNFQILADHIHNNVNSIVHILQSRSCPTIKSSVEALVGGFLGKIFEIGDHQADKLKKKQQNLSTLEYWYNTNFKELKDPPKLVLIIPDFEKFNPTILQNIVSILTCYLKKLPIVLVFGVATYIKTIHNVLPSNIASKLNLNVFQTEPATSMLNKILESTILTPKSSFQLSGKSFNVLMEIFLFFDFSLNGFVKGFKIFMLEHFYNNRYAVLSCHPDQNFVEKLVMSYSHEECENLRESYPSFRKWVEGVTDPQKRINILENDEFFKKRLLKQLPMIKSYWNRFYCFLGVLVIFIEDLPKNNLGKSLRELYPLCISTEITKIDEFKEVVKLLKFTSREKFLIKIAKVRKVFQQYLHKNPDKRMERHLENLDNMKINLEKADLSMKKVENSEQTSKNQLKGAPSRLEMMEQLKHSAQERSANTPQSEYEEVLCQTIDHILIWFESFLCPVQNGPPFIETCLFADYQTARRQIIGAPRGALHMALTNPHNYLQCECCITDNDQVLSTQPDVCIAYKLHLECGKFINLYDWLLAFKTVVQASENCEDPDDDFIDPQLQ